MGNTNWEKAIRNYQRRKDEPPKPEVLIEREATSQVFRSLEMPKPPSSMHLVGALAEALDRFLKSESGKTALKLLEVSGESVTLAVSDSRMRHCTVIFLDGKGLRSSYEAAGMWVAYAKKEDIPKPVTSSCDIREAAEEICSYNPEISSVREFMNDLRWKINQIAKSSKY